MCPGARRIGTGADIVPDRAYSGAESLLRGAGNLCEVRFMIFKSRDGRDVASRQQLEIADLFRSLTLISSRKRLRCDCREHVHIRPIERMNLDYFVEFLQQRAQSGFRTNDVRDGSQLEEPRASVLAGRERKGDKGIDQGSRGISATRTRVSKPLGPGPRCRTSRRLARSHRSSRSSLW
jgi:hypothetical protein